MKKHDSDKHYYVAPEAEITGKDIYHAVIRIAPTFPSLDDVEVAVAGLCTCLLLAIEERDAGAPTD